MAEPVHAALRRLGLRVRVYAPVGELVAGMAYLVRRLLENTSNESFIRQRFARGAGARAADRTAAAGRTARAERADVRAPADRRRVTAGPFANEPHAELRRRGPRARLAAAVARGAGRLRLRRRPC